MKILFLGSPKFSVMVLKKLLTSSHEVVAIATQPDRPSGRGHKLKPTELKSFAQENNIKVLDFDKICQHLDEVEKVDYDVAVTASFGQILTERFLAIKPCINVHPSLLPSYRGATPLQSALLNGDCESGVTIMKVVREVDAGDILIQEKVSINLCDNYTSLETKLAELGGELLVKVLDNFDNMLANAKKQDNTKATFCKKLSKEDCFIDLNYNAQTLVNKTRALNEMGCFILIDGERVKIEKLIDASGENFEFDQNGLAKNLPKRIVLKCNNSAIEILSLQSKNGKMVSAKDFLNGMKLEGKKIN